MPSTTSNKKPVALRPRIPKELIGRRISGPIDAAVLKAASMALMKALD